MPGCFHSHNLTPNRIEAACQRMAAHGGYLDLTSSNPTRQGLRFPPHILQAAAAPYWATRIYQPDPLGMPAARAAIAHYYTTRTPPVALPDDAIYITASTSEAYSLLFALLADPGDNLLAPAVTYPLFDYLAAIHRLELRPYRLDERRGWQLDAAHLLQQVDDRTRAILIISPHNPTGAVVQQHVPALEQTGLPLICDEVFAAFTYGVAAVPPMPLLQRNQPVFLLNGISKLFALPDLKLGWIVLNSAARRAYGARLELLNDTFLGANALVQHMLPTLFAQGMPFVGAMVQHVQQHIGMVHAWLEHTPWLSLPPAAPDGGYYLFPAVQVPGWGDEEELVLALLERGRVLVHPGYFYGDVAGTHIMLSALTSSATLAQGLERLGNALAALAAGQAAP